MQRFLDRSPVPGLLLALLAAALLGLAACGGGGTDAVAGATGTSPGAGDGATTTVATLASVAPTTLDRDAGGTLTLRGTGFTGRLEVRMVDAQGRPVGRTLAADANPDGTRATCPVPAMPGLGRSVAYDVQVANGDGRDVDGTTTVTFTREFRAVDGTGNHAVQTSRGSTGIPLRRDEAAAYADGVSALAGADRPNARAISNAVCGQTEDLPAARGASAFLWQWGQFVDHDIDLTPEADPAEPEPIAVPLGDASFDPFASGTVVLPFNRSAYVEGVSPRQQVNEITAWIDASNVYGSDDVRARALRTLDGTGRLATSEDDLLPFNTTGLPNAGGTDAGLYLAGDVRANEQLALTSMHVLFVREHNRIADELRQRDPQLAGEDVYLEARRRVGALIQVITYREFLPLLLGDQALPAYAGYDPAVDASIANLFSTSAYRFGHSLIGSTLLRLDADGNEIPEGHLALRDAFFHPSRLVAEGGIDPILRGLQAEPSQALDCRVVEDVRSFLFGPPGAGGLDLAALNVQRGRDHGLPSYNDVREARDLPRRATFAEVSSDPDVQTRLASAYDEVDDLDAWIGCLAEDHVEGALVGDLLRRVLADQFRRLRDGDRFWYQRIFRGETLDELEATRLADVIRRNTAIGEELPRDVFRVGGGRPRTQPLEAQPLTEEREARIRRWHGTPPRPR